MIIYNVTVNIDASVAKEWLRWMQEVHVPDVMRTGLFMNSRILQVLGDDESGGHTYSVQYTCDSMEKYKEYEKSFAPTIQAEHTKKFEGQFVAFRTLLKEV